jgi:hypothetical protein
LQTNWTSSLVLIHTVTRTRVVEVRSGVVVFESSVSADSRGYAEALRVAERHAPGRRAFAVEGTGSFGAGLTGFLADRGEQVFEVGRFAAGAPLGREDRSARRGPGSSERVRTETACDAAQPRRTRGATAIGGRP